MDTSSALDDVTLSAVDTCDLVILLTNQDIPSGKDAHQFLQIADALKIIRKRVLFVMNRFDKRIGITPEKIGQSFKHEVSVVIPYDEKTIIPSKTADDHLSSKINLNLSLVHFYRSPKQCASD